MKKFLSKALLVMGTSILVSTSVFATTFKDVSEKHWAYNYAVDMQKRGLMVVNSKGEFLPNEAISYFEISEILARATDYIDEKINPNMDAKLKEAIRLNYEKQKPLLDQYGVKYTAWEKAYNEEIAYLVGREYIKDTDLSKFMVKTAAGKQVKNNVTKQDLAVFLVRVLRKEKTAKDEFALLKTTGFKDEAKIKEENRAHMTYLKKIGVIAADANGNCNPNDEVTRAIGAKMLAQVLKERDSQTSTETPAQATTFSATVKKVTPKSDSQEEFYIVLDTTAPTSFYTIKKTAQIVDASGNPLTIAAVTADSKVTVTTEKVENTDYITKLVLQGTTTIPTVPETTKAVEGTIDRVGKNGDISIATSSGIVSYVVDSSSLLLVGGQRATIDDLAAGMGVKVYAQGTKVVRIESTGITNNGNSGTVPTPNSKLTVRSVVNKKDTYLFKLMQGEKASEVSVPKDAKITRNGKTATLKDIRVGDVVSFTNKNGVVDAVTITSTEVRVDGTITSILIAAQSQVTITNKKGVETFTVTPNSDIYNKLTRKDLTISGLELGQEIEVRLESNEAVAITVVSEQQGVSYKGTVESLGKSNTSVEVLVEYDPLTGDTMVLKSVDIPLEVEILYDGKTEHRSILEEGMEVILVYASAYDTLPQKIMIIK